MFHQHQRCITHPSHTSLPYFSLQRADHATVRFQRLSWPWRVRCLTLQSLKSDWDGLFSNSWFRQTAVDALIIILVQESSIGVVSFSNALKWWSCWPSTINNHSRNQYYISFFTHGDRRSSDASIDKVSPMTRVQIQVFLYRPYISIDIISQTLFSSSSPFKKVIISSRKKKKGDTDGLLNECT